MRRREFTAGLLLAAVPWSARAQQRATRRRIAIFHPAIPVSLLTETGGGTAWRAFFPELRRLGYVEGENIIIERYSAEGHHERYAELAREIVAAAPDLIVTGTNSPPISTLSDEPLKSSPTGCARPLRCFARKDSVTA